MSHTVPPVPPDSVPPDSRKPDAVRLSDPAAGTGGSTGTLQRCLPAIVVHNALRREFRLAGPLVRRVEVGDVARAQFVGRHLDFLLRGLHHHHELEDDMIWPQLRQRASSDALEIVDVMQAQHDEIDRLVRGTTLLVTMWSTDADEDVRDGLAEELEALHAVLVQHLDMEEHVVLPLAERLLTLAEWRELGRRAEAGNPRSERVLAFGMLQYGGDAEVLASMLESAPLPARILVPRLARRAYRRHAVAIHGTPAP